MSLSVSSTTSMKQIMAVQKLIPVYQRNFVWDSDLRSGFFDDLLDAFHKNEEYFIGSMVFRDNRGIYEIVDGQQRITTIFLLFSTALKLAQDYDEEKNYQQWFNQKQGVLYVADIGSAESTMQFMPSLRHADKEINKAYVSIALGQMEFSNETDGVMITNLDEAQADAKRALENFVVNHKSKAFRIIELLKFIEDKVVCIHHVARDLDAALTIYSRLNSTGKALTKFEILKGMSFQEAEKSNLWDEIDHGWSALEDLLSTKVQFGGKGHAKELIKDDTVLSYKLFIDLPEIGRAVNGNGDAWVGGDKLSKLVLSDSMKKMLHKDPVAFVNGIASFVTEIKLLREATSIPNEEVRNYLIDISCVAGTQTQWLMVAILLYRHFPNSAASFRALRNMVIVFSVALTGSGSSSAIYKRLSEKLSVASKGRAPSEDEESEVINDMKREVRLRWSDYEYELSNLRYSRRSDRKLLRHIFELVEVEFHHEFQVGNYKNLSDFLFQKKLNLDHLQPTGLNRFGEEFQHQLGNLCLLSEPANKGLRSLPFETDDKQETIKKSEFWSTKALVEGVFHGQEKRATETFISRKTLSEESVNERTSEILAFLNRQLTS